jgi:hypothetical protein
MPNYMSAIKSLCPDREKFVVSSCFALYRCHQWYIKTITIKITSIKITFQLVPTFLITKNVMKGDITAIMRAASVTYH